MSVITYIGSFPPPYGGVTVKNALLYKHLSERLSIEKIDLSMVKSLDAKTVVKFAGCLLSRNGALVLGVSAEWRHRLTYFLFRFNRRKMARSSLFVMGGKVPDDADYVRKMGCYRHMYVETESMRRAFEAKGAHNVSVYPNCRERPAVPVVVRKTSSGGGLRAVFFSLISKEKGAALILEAARKVPSVEFHFYGRVEPSFVDEFKAYGDELSNVEYHGVFDSVKDDVLGELNQYDLHLFPTLCPNEGVPGVIPETKLAAVPTIASNRGYNAELIEDGVDGVLTNEDTADELAAVVESLASDPTRIDAMKAAALGSAERYCIDRYIDWLCADLSDFVGGHA